MSKPIKVTPYVERDAVRVEFDDGLCIDVTGLEMRQECMAGDDRLSAALIAKRKRLASTQEETRHAD